MRIQIRGKGRMTLPVELRRKYEIEDGDVISIIDLGDGALLLTPDITRADRLGDRIAKAVEETGVAENEIT
ncbi:MAG: AbrB/MazE/SpoVT family DNA-binding domain-containing protein [Anaerolineales bacterium]